ncbi:MAG: hypothetical protein JWL73_1973 [Actinomycetia bacterium]|nr:hypothetical protein [Actinomycetes bacterium]
MTNVSTNLLSFTRPGLWMRVRAASADGLLSGLEHGAVRLEAYGLQRDQECVSALYGWYRERVPVQAAFCLWYLRDAQDRSGALCRSRTQPVSETNPVARFLHFARLVGEDCGSDMSVKRAAQWLVDVQLADGSMPTAPSDGNGEAGTTARAARALHGLGPTFDDAVERMWGSLARTARPSGPGVAWSAGVGQVVPASGATGLAALALLDAGDEFRNVAAAAGRWLVAAQREDGGWSELESGESTSHNAFNALRALYALRRAGALDQETLDECARRASSWMDTHWDALGVGRVMDVAFTLRLAAMLGRVDTRTADLARRLAERATEALDRTSDAYDTEVLGLALVEWSRCADERGAEAEWRWRLPRLLPPFVRNGNEIYDVFYLVSEAPWWRRGIDWAVRRNLVESFGGRVLGVVAALAIIDDRVARYLSASGHIVVSIILIAAIVVSAAAWTAMRCIAAARWSGVIASLVISVALGWLVADTTLSGNNAAAGSVVGRIALVVLTTLIVDAVSYTADRSGLIARFLPAD